MDKWILKFVVPSVICFIILYILCETFLEWTYTNLLIHQTELEMKIMDISDETFSTTMNGSLSCETREPQFLNENRPIVALASFPGSGNSWMRQILESVTGIYTGSINHDFKASFWGSKRCHADGGVFIVKTHFPNATAYTSSTRYRRKCKMTTDFTRAILIVRNPYDAMIATYNLVNGGKIGFARKQQFFSEGWKRSVEKCSIKWRNHLLFWLTKFDNPLHVLIYEDLKANTVKETYKVLKFLDFPVNFTALACLNEDSAQKKYSEQASHLGLQNATFTLQK